MEFELIDNSQPVAGEPGVQQTAPSTTASQSLPTQDNMIEAEGLGQSVLEAPTTTVPRAYYARDRMEPAEYNTYMDSLDPETRRDQQEEDLRLNPGRVLARKLVTDPVASFTAGAVGTQQIGDATVPFAPQLLSLGRLISPFMDANTNKYVTDSIVQMNKSETEAAKKYGTGYAVGSFMGRNAASIAAAAYSGGSLPLLLTLETGSQALDIPSQPGKDGVTPVDPVEGAASAAINVGLAGTAHALSQALPYIFRGFQSENIADALNPVTELGKENYTQLANAIDYANEKGIRLSEIMVRGSGQSKDGVQLVQGTNYFALREMFKGSDEFSAQSLDMLQDITALGKKQENFSNLSVSGRRASMETFQKEVKALRKEYYKREGEIWGKVNDYMPEYKIELKDFNAEMSAYLTKNGLDSQVISTVNNISTRRFATGYKEMNKELDQVTKDIKANSENFKAWKFANKDATQDQYLKAIGEYTRTNDALKAKAVELRRTVKVSPKDLLNNIKLINKKINVPGGNISLHDAEQIRGLRLAKDLMETKLRDLLAEGGEDSAKALQYWDEAKALTVQRVKAFGNNHTDESLVLTNALLDKDNSKVLTMLSDPDMGLKHMDFIKQNFGQDSEAFKSASSLFLKAKIGMLDNASKFKEKGTLVSGLRGDFSKVETAVAAITPADIRFITKNFGQVGKDLNGYIRMVEQYSNLQQQASRLATGRGQMSAWRYVGNNPSEVLGVMGDLLSYGAAKGMSAFIRNMPKARAVAGGAVGALYSINSGEEIGSDEFYKQVITGAGVGWGVGVAGRHIFEPQIEQVIRILGGRGDVKTKVKAVDKLMDSLKRTAKSIKDGKLKTNTPYDGE